MRYGVSHRWILAGLCVLSVGLLGWPAPSRAQLLGTVTGTVTNPIGTVTGTGTGIIGGTTTVLGDTGALAAGTVDALDASATSASIPSLLTADAPSAAVIGYADQIDSSASLAGLTLAVAGITITVDSVVAQAVAPLGAPGAGISYIDNLAINGVSVPADGSVNQTVALPGGQLVLNEQQVLSDGTIVVNAMHATISGIADIVIASTMAGASGGEAKAVQATTL